ncbi:MAG: mycothiol system anti-sigma-R factor [Acidimicrobiales bacterium]
MAHEDERGGCGDGASGVDCVEAVRQLYVFLDGELTEQRRREIAVHLDECGPCADAAGFEAELRAVISSRCKDRVPESLIQRVAAAIAAEESGGSSGPLPATK